MTDPQHDPHADAAETPISISRLFHTFQAYLPIILLSLTAVAIGYSILAIGLYLLAPAKRITTIAFRLDFEGIERGEFPNGVKFSPPEIISTPILLKVYNANELKRFTSFPQFTRSIFVLESNAAYEALAAEYQARLSDTRLTSVDRERIQREYEQKRDSLSKHQYSLSYLRPEEGDIPETVVRKVLGDILQTWALIAVNEKRVLSYRVPVLSPSTLEPIGIEKQDPLLAVHVLRTKTTRVFEQLRIMNDLPGADLVRTKTGLSIADISLRLEEVMRFRLEPLLPQVSSTQPAAAERFLQVQLAYDQRQLQAQQQRSAAIHDALSLYTQSKRLTGDGETSSQPTGRPPATPDKPAGSETVMPQMNDTFLDRLVALTSSHGDMVYRQRQADSYRQSVAQQVPLQLAVAYDEQLLNELRRPAGTTPADVLQQIDETRTEVRQLVVAMNEIYTLASSNLHPSTQLYALAETPRARVERSQSMARLALGGVLVLLVAFPIILGLALLHNRMRQEEQDEEYEAAADAEHATT